MKNKLIRSIFFLFLTMSILIGGINVVPAETITVMEEGGLYDSIQKGIDAASPGDTLSIKGGTYRENVRLDKDLTLEGSGGAEIVAPDEGIGLPVILLGPSDVSVRITGMKLMGASKAEKGACRDADAGLCPAGISVVGEARLTMSDSEVSGNYLAGIYVRGKAGVVAGGNRILNNNGSGVYLRGSSDSEFSQNEVSGNGRGFYVRADAHIAAVKNSVEGNEREGFFVRGDAEVTARGNSVKDNDDEGFRLEDSSTVAVVENDLDGNGGGISVRGSSSARILDNNILNCGAGIGALGEGRITAQGNSIYDQGESGIGIAFLDSSAGEIDGNEIEVNLIGIYSFSPESVTGEGNRVLGNGVELFGNVDGSLRTPQATQRVKKITYPDTDYPDMQTAVDSLIPGGTLVINNGEYSESITVTKDITVKGEEPGKVIIHGSSVGFSLVGQAEAMISGIEFTELIGDAVALGRSSSAVIVNCAVQDAGGSGVRLLGSANASLENCTIQGTEDEALWLEGTSSVEVTGTKVIGARGVGIRLSDQAELAFRDSTITGSKYEGISLKGSSRATIVDSYVIKNGDDGLNLRDSSMVELENATVRGNAGPGLKLSDSSTLKLTGSEITENEEEGLYLKDEVTATVTGGTIAGNGDSGIFLMEEAGLILEDNELTGNPIGLELKYPNRFKGSVTGSGNEITGTESGFEGISETLQKELLKN